MSSFNSEQTSGNRLFIIWFCKLTWVQFLERHSKQSGSSSFWLPHRKIFSTWKWGWHCTYAVTIVLIVLTNMGWSVVELLCTGCSLIVLNYGNNLRKGDVNTADASAWENDKGAKKWTDSWYLPFIIISHPSLLYTCIFSIALILLSLHFTITDAK